jgi:hypothetical protein
MMDALDRAVPFPQIEMVPETPILPLGVVNAQPIRSPRGSTLVDAGIPGSDRRTGQVLTRRGLSFADIKLIMVARAGTDHMGSASLLRVENRKGVTRQTW